MNEDLIYIIKKIREKITDESDMVYTHYDNAKTLRDELDQYCLELLAGNTNCLKELNILFAPTGSLQEHSICNGWSEEYIKLAEIFDMLYHSKKAT